MNLLLSVAASLSTRPNKFESWEDGLNAIVCNVWDLTDSFSLKYLSSNGKSTKSLPSSFFPYLNYILFCDFRDSFTELCIELIYIFEIRSSYGDMVHDR